MFFSFKRVNTSSESITSIAAYEAISQLQDEIEFMPVMEECDKATDELIRQRKNELVSILSRAKPLTGGGYFNVDSPMIISVIGQATTYIIILVQFNTSEKPATCPNSVIALNTTSV